MSPIRANFIRLGVIHKGAPTHSVPVALSADELAKRGFQDAAAAKRAREAGNQFWC